MAVKLCGQPEVSQILLKIASLFHGTQGLGGQRALIRLSFQAIQYALQRLRFNRAASCRDRDPEKTGGIEEGGHFLGIGRFVDAVDEGHFLTEYIFGDRFVRSQHKILDDPVGHTAFALFYFNRFPLLIYDDLGFGQIKIDGPPFAAGFLQDLRKLEHQKKGILQVGVFLGDLRAGRPLDHSGHVAVGQPLAAFDHRFFQVEGKAISLFVKFHKGRKGKPVHLRIQRTDAV
ncbi:hypothetical protein SDC9_118903 [bioreactor metagenome]|uniref:Uncharacterized protein n=1 Tax=bioreactor metagenome TaxID=1076179 RepID=A0A645C4N7_9ZZZZ